jgi:hypothetical protein
MSEYLSGQAPEVGEGLGGVSLLPPMLDYSAKKFRRKFREKTLGGSIRARPGLNRQRWELQMGHGL